MARLNDGKKEKGDLVDDVYCLEGLRKYTIVSKKEKKRSEVSLYQNKKVVIKVRIPNQPVKLAKQKGGHLGFFQRRKKNS